MGAETVVGIGGGSSMDSAKGAAIPIANPGTKILDYKGDYTGVNRFKNMPVPCFAIPTTAGTGSESSWNIAINDTDNVKKVRDQSPYYVPVMSILDAKMMATVPGPVAAACGIDAFVHCFEAYISTNGAWAFSDFMALEGMRLISENIRQFVANPGNAEAGQAMMIGATLGGAVMGDHCSPISDTTIMASTGAQCYHLNHVATQLPYAVTVAAVAFVNYIIAGMIQNVVIDLIIAVVSMVVVMLIIGKVNHSMNIHSQRD